MRPAKVFVVCFAAIALAAIAGAAAGPSSGASESDDLELGKKVYTTACEECHGSEGHGDGPKARKLGFHPRRFNLGSFKCRCTESGALPTDEDLYRVVTRGMSGTPMQPHEKTLSEAERRAVVQYIKTLTPRFASEPPPQCVRLSSPIPASGQSISEGRQIYRLLSCWKCHGKTGKGDGPASPGLKDDWGNPIRAYNFTVMKRFKCGTEDVDIYRTMLTGMNGSPMPSYAAALLFARESVSDMASFQAAFDAAELKELQDFVGHQPDEAAVKAMAAPVRDELVDKRAWSLVHYLKSLTEK
jgi:mono/diheme cytochrome c family protein